MSKQKGVTIYTMPIMVRVTPIKNPAFFEASAPVE